MFPIVAVIVIALDQLSKLWVKNNLFYNSVLELRFNLFQFHYIHNDGAAFSSLSGKQTLLIIFTAVLMLIIVVYFFYYRKTISNLEKFSLGLILGGGIGNMIDRILYSYVIDFVELRFMNFPIFNVADIAITCGCILFAITILFSRKE